MSMYESVPQLIKMLENLDRWIDKGVAHAKAKSFDPNVLAQARLAPDQYPLVKQVQSACDSAKFAAAYLSNTKAPAHADTETTIDELKARIKVCTDFLKTIDEKSFAGAEERKVAPPWMKGAWMRGDHYLTQLALPNFYFHITTAYAILRNNGVDVGKMDFIGNMPMNPGLSRCGGGRFALPRRSS